MKVKNLSKAAIIICIALFTVCAFICGIQSAQAEDEWKLYYWGFENTLADEAGSLTSGTEGTFAAGKQGQALNVAENGAVKSEKLTIDTTKGFTLSAWIYLNQGAEGYNIVMSHGNTMADDLGRFQIHIAQASAEAGGGYIRAFAPAIDPIAFPDEAADAEEYQNCFVPYETWTHVAVTFNGEKAVLYVNGVQTQERTAVGILEAGPSIHHYITLGALNHDAQMFSFNGLIDEAVYANYPMKSDEISLMASDTSGAATKLSALAKGTETIVPDNVVTPPEQTPDSGTEKPQGGTTVYYWPLEEDGIDISHHEIDFEYNGMGFDYAEGIVGNGAEAYYGGNISDALEEEFELKAFTISMWTRIDSIENGTNYAVLFAAGGKENPYHFEVYITMLPDDENALLAFYNTGTGGAMEGLAEIKREELTHIALAYDGERLKIYVNGESVFDSKKTLVLDGFSSNFDSLALGSLVDTTLPVVGMFDEVIFADYAFDEALIKKLHSNPSEAATDIKALVEANYPEGYTPPTKAPDPTNAPATATPEASSAATADATAATTASNTSSSQKTPVKTSQTSEPTDEDNTTTVLIIIIIVTVVVIAAAVVVLMLAKKKAGKK